MRTFLHILFCALLISLSACNRATFEERVADAEARLGAGDARAALSDYRSIAEKFRDDPRRAGILLRVADLYSTALDDTPSAILAYGEAIKAKPLSQAAQVAHERRAELLEAKGDYEGAIADYSTLLKHFGFGVDAYRYRVLLAGAYISGRNYRQARVEIKQLVEGKDIPDDVREQALFLAAESFFIEGNTERAAEYYQWFLRDFPKSTLAPEVKLHMATCLEEMGYMGMARDLTRSARSEYANEKVVDARLKSIEDRGGTEQSSKPKKK